MQTCFLFARYLDEAHCLSLRLDESGNVDAPLVTRTAEEFRALQQNAQTLVVLPTDVCSLHELALPKLSDSKVRAAIPYALEEQLAESVALLHFAFMHHPEHVGHVLVAVLNKQYIIDLLQRLALLEITYDDMTLDWFALAENEMCVVGHILLVHHALFKGAVGVEQMVYTLKTLQPAPSMFVFDDTLPLLNDTTTTQLVTQPSLVWIASKLQQRHYLNICQGEFAHDTKQRMTRRWFLWAGVLAGVWFVSGLLLKTILLLTLNHQISNVDKQIAVVYKVFFPDAQTVISPRFRVEQLLKQNQSGTDAMLWHLLEKLPAALFPEGLANIDKTIQIKSLRYQSGALVVNLVCHDFKALESLELRLQHLRVTVRQLAAAQKDKQVLATLELK